MKPQGNRKTIEHFAVCAYFSVIPFAGKKDFSFPVPSGIQNKAVSRIYAKFSGRPQRELFIRHDSLQSDMTLLYNVGTGSLPPWKILASGLFRAERPIL